LNKPRRPELTVGEQIWGYIYIYVGDVSEAFCVVLETEANGIFNLGSGNAIKLRSVVEQIRDLIDPRLPIGFGDLLYRPPLAGNLERNLQMASRKR
jgi:UDP-glucose 4-epimerase